MSTMDIRNVTAKYITELKENFPSSSEWFTKTRLEIIKSYIDRIESTPPEIQRAFEWFVANDKKPSLKILKERLILERERSKSNQSYADKKEAYDCLECGGTHIVWVKHPEKNSYLTMACDACDGKDENWHNFWDLHIYTPSYVKVPSPVMKLIKEANELGRLGLGNSLYTSLVAKTVKVCKESRAYFKEKDVKGAR